jgi:hypothetical protein
MVKRKMNMVMDIDKDFVKFYDYKFLEMDSISKKTGQNWQTNTLSDQLIIRKVNSFDNQAFYDNMYDYFTINSTDKMNWKIGTETKKQINTPYRKQPQILEEENGRHGSLQKFLFRRGLINLKDYPVLFSNSRMPIMILNITCKKHQYSGNLFYSQFPLKLITAISLFQ